MNAVYSQDTIETYFVATEFSFEAVARTEVVGYSIAFSARTRYSTARPFSGSTGQKGATI